MSRSAIRPLAVLALASVAAFGLAACSTGTPDAPATTASASTPSVPATSAAPVPSETAATPTATATPTASSTATADAGSPVGIACNALITKQQMYDFNPNFTLTDDYTPKAGSRSATIVGLGGVACRWVNDSSGEKIDVAVAKLGPDALASWQDKLGKTSKPVTAFGDPGYFTVDGSTGQADVFHTTYRIVLDSTYFTAAGDANQLVQDVVAALG